MGLLDNLDGGKLCAISQEVFDYFLEVLPPVAFGFRWNNERWSYGFAEGYDFVYAFKKEGDKFFAQKTDLLNPHECGVPLDRQQQQPGFSEKFKQAKEELRTRSWIPTWLKLGKENQWIRQAGDPPFTTQSFHACVHDEELLDKFAHGNWCLGQAFYRGEVCFIQQVDGGDEWLVIKQDHPFESISFGRIIANKGRHAAQEILFDIRNASVERCRALEP